MSRPSAGPQHPTCILLYVIRVAACAGLLLLVPLVHTAALPAAACRGADPCTAPGAAQIHLDPSAPAPGAAVQAFMHAVLPALLACRHGYARLSAYVDAVEQDSNAVGALSDVDQYLGPARDACTRAQAVLGAPLAPALRAVAPVVAFQASGLRTIQAAAGSVARLYHLLTAPCNGPSPTSCHEVGADRLFAQIRKDAVIPRFVAPLTLADRVIHAFNVVMPSQHGWSAGFSPLPGDLDAVACPSRQVCYAVGGVDDRGTIVATDDGGATWSAQTSGIRTPLVGIACPDTTTCYAVGQANPGDEASGVIVVTRDGGAHWVSRPVSSRLSGIACTTTTTCYVVDSRNGVLLETRDGGVHWHNQSLPAPLWSLASIACPSVTTCDALGATNPDASADGDTRAVMATTRDGGAHWRSQAIATYLPDPATPDALACPGPATCYVILAGQTIVSTGDGGAHWRSRAAPAAGHGALRNISCPGLTTCYAVGDNGWIATTRDGLTWRLLPGLPGLADTTLRAIAWPDSLTAYIVGDYGTIEVTTTGGSERAQRTAPPTALPTALTTPTPAATSTATPATPAPSATARATPPSTAARASPSPTAGATSA